jgi:hypothetical protein
MKQDQNDLPITTQLEESGKKYSLLHKKLSETAESDCSKEDIEEYLKCVNSFRKENVVVDIVPWLKEKACLKVREPSVKSLVQQTYGHSRVISENKFWRIEGVDDRGKIETYDLLKNFLPSGTQDEFLQRRIEAEKNGGFYCGSMPLQYAVLEALHDSKESEDREEAKNFIKKDMNENGLITLTTINYNSSGKDTAFHNFALSGEYARDAYIHNLHRKITLDDEEVLEALLLTKDVSKVNKVLEWVYETPVYFWTFQQNGERVIKPVKRVARIESFSKGNGIYCCGFFSSTGLALGLRRVKEEESNTMKLSSISSNNPFIGD